MNIPVKLRRFVLQRDEDVNNFSGTGIVVEGVEFSNGWVALTWRSHLTSLSFYSSIKVAEEVHGHDGKTKLIWLDEE